MISSITNHISKGVTNISDTSIKQIWFKTNFNMPVKNYSSGTYTRYQGPVTYDTESLSYDLSGFVPGYEICNNVSVYDFENNESLDWSIDCYIYLKWYDTDGTSVLFTYINGYHLTYTLSPAYWSSIYVSGNIGCAGWEVGVSGTYYLKSWTTGNPAITTVSTNISISNVPSVTQLSTSTSGYIWVEGNDLCYVNAQRWKHTMIGVYVDSLPGTSNSGHIWLDGTDLHWVGNNGFNYKAAWNIKQFTSYYSNSSTGSTFAGISKYGTLWVDNEFGLTHLAYIASDGYKYLTGAGDNPY